MIPWVPAGGSVIAMTTYQSASPALVIQALAPSSTYPDPSRTARVFWFAASEPDCGSVSAYAPSALPEASGVRIFFFCSSVPNFQIG